MVGQPTLAISWSVSRSFIHPAFLCPSPLRKGCQKYWWSSQSKRERRPCMHSARHVDGCVPVEIGWSRRAAEAPPAVVVVPPTTRNEGSLVPTDDGARARSSRVTVPRRRLLQSSCRPGDYRHSSLPIRSTGPRPLRSGVHTWVMTRAMSSTNQSRPLPSPEVPTTPGYKWVAAGHSPRTFPSC
jgi:hypothetical protein